ncbi:adenosine kinase [Micromonospora polyrhachis]|uniref:Sugar/nucleoside kinase (Ribokinase family) n=1 Tax=Micromonospora polyrhachis TaxID=1282883 RepID=A0A7W7SWC7_9ACTN|nr:adenosine kinase [Micromonospora polyrhachis]MBB4962154.1 sugar/nucleoside kinase (ribokinase family) [Micromonospora polyrhachis]
MSDQTDVLVLGGAGVDTIVHVPDLPLPFQDSYHVPAIEMRAGQTGDNVALGLRALGLRTVHIDVLGDDREGELVRALHEAYDIPLLAVPTGAGTKRAVNLVDPTGRRLSLYDGSRSDDSDRLPAELLAAHTSKARLVHVSITHPCQHAIGQLVDSAAVVSTDLHDWDGENPYHEAFAYAADVVFLSATALVDGPAALRRIIDAGRARIVVATAGAQGGYALVRGEDEIRPFTAVRPVAPVIDSNGAGDAFVAGFLCGHLAGAPVETCLRYGAIAGAHACTVPSTRVDPIARSVLLDRAAIPAVSPG